MVYKRYMYTYSLYGSDLKQFDKRFGNKPITHPYIHIKYGPLPYSIITLTINIIHNYRSGSSLKKSCNNMPIYG